MRLHDFLEDLTPSQEDLIRNYEKVKYEYRCNPDSEYTIDMMEDYGYKYSLDERMLPIGYTAAKEISADNINVWILNKDDTSIEAVFSDENLIRSHIENGGLFGVKEEDYECYINKAIKRSEQETSSLHNVASESKEATRALKVNSIENVAAIR